MNDFIVDTNDNSILSEALEAFSQQTPEEQHDIILLLQCLSSLELLLSAAPL